MNYILESDSFDVVKLAEWLNGMHLNEDIQVYLLTQEKNNEKFTNHFNYMDNVICITYNTIFEYIPKVKLKPSDYFEFNQSYSNDSITSLLFDRDGYFPSYGIGNNHGMSFYRHVAIGVLGFLLDNKIDFVYFRNTPHHSIEWLLAKASDYLKIKIFTSERHIFPWLFSISEGFYRNRNLVAMPKPSSTELEILKLHIEKFVLINSNQYKQAIPSYEKNRLSRGLLKYYNPFKHLREFVIRPHKFINRTHTFFSYKRLSSKIDINETFVVFFLHYQPERTTLPEGYEFSDQLFAIQILRMVLPANIRIVVKEHPSMFTNQSEPKARNTKLYKMLLKINGVSLESIDTDSFDLIDNALAIATITGTVGLQSYIRKTPVIFFGRSKLNVIGVHVFQNVDSLQNFIDSLCSNKVRITNVSEELFNQCLVGAISGLPENISDHNIDYHLASGFQQNAHFKLLSNLIKKFYKDGN